MSDQYDIDSHKLAYHPREVAKLLDAENDVSKLLDIYPIYVEVSPVGACNHRCSFCAVDYIGYVTANKLDVDTMFSVLDEMGDNGVKSIMFAGEGEPLVHNKINEIVEKTKSVGIDISFTTNAVAMTDKFIEKSLKYISWVKVSFNAGTAENYAKVHGTKEKDFNTVIQNMKKAVAYRNKYNLDCVIGAQSVLLPENADDMYNLALILRDEIGADYFVVKPFSQEPNSINRQYEDINYQSKSLRELESKINDLEREGFKVNFRSKTMDLYHEDQSDRYTTCYSTPVYMGYLMADGSVYGCKDHLLEPEFCYGNINKNTFNEIWKGNVRRKGLDYVLNSLDVSKCRVNCRMDKVNRYLFDLKENKKKHVNFI